MNRSTDSFAYRAAIGAASLAAVVVLASASAADAPKGWKAPRTPDGRPDLQGTWSNATVTPIERDRKYGDRLVLTAKEAAEAEGANANFIAEADKPTDPKHGIQDLPKDCGGGFTGTNCGYNNFWIDAGNHLITINGEKRSSIITDPANGRVPPPKAAAGQATGRPFRGGGGMDGPEVRPLGERCLLSFDSSSGPPMLPALYNNNYQIVQTPTEIKILVEMVHDVRTIRIGGERLPSSMRLWMGDSIGRWEGDTLVVETTNFRTEQFFRGTSPDRKVIERFTRVSPTEINYKFTIEDAARFEKPWGGELIFNATNEKIYEYACHEGNYAMPGILAGARAEEAAKAQKSP